MRIQKKEKRRRRKKKKEEKERCKRGVLEERSCFVAENVSA
jgi:hypothetical protein